MNLLSGPTASKSWDVQRWQWQQRMASEYARMSNVGLFRVTHGTELNLLRWKL